MWDGRAGEPGRESVVWGRTRAPTQRPKGGASTVVLPGQRSLKRGSHVCPRRADVGYPACCKDEDGERCWRSTRVPLQRATSRKWLKPKNVGAISAGQKPGLLKESNFWQTVKPGTSETQSDRDAEGRGRVSRNNTPRLH